MTNDMGHGHTFYTYLLGWTEQNKFYYGVRYSKHAKIEDLGTTYLSSSKYVTLHIQKFGKPDVIQVRKIHKTKECAIAWESKVLRRMRVIENDMFLNRWDNNMVPLNIEGPFPFQSTEIQNKINDTLLERYNGRGSGSLAIKNKVFETNTIRYGVHHTLHTSNVAEARHKGSITKYGTTNPFYSKIFQESLTNPMFDDEVRKKHKIKMESMDWSERNDKIKATNLEKYGVPHIINAPWVREKHNRSCPICTDGTIHNAGNFVKHMKFKHNWTPQQIKGYKNEN